MAHKGTATLLSSGPSDPMWIYVQQKGHDDRWSVVLVVVGRTCSENRKFNTVTEADQ